MACKYHYIFIFSFILANCNFGFGQIGWDKFTIVKEKGNNYEEGINEKGVKYLKYTDLTNSGESIRFIFYMHQENGVDICFKMRIVAFLATINFFIENFELVKMSENSYIDADKQWSVTKLILNDTPWYALDFIQYK
tara:strand:- start:65 stop:475 length:411 start_codon:yes stop_codon:yes gene_type:complete